MKKAACKNTELSTFRSERRDTYTPREQSVQSRGLGRLPGADRAASKRERRGSAGRGLQSDGISHARAEKIHHKANAI